jgi:tripartite-type tricarboxylate transporter receptor subunit TctC
MDSRLQRTARALLACALLAVHPAASGAQPESVDHYPSKVIRIIAPTAPGGGSSISARLIADEMTQRAGRQVAIIENRPGAGTRIGTELVAKAKPDGYTLLMTPSTLATNPTGFRDMPYDGLRDFEPITQVLYVPNLVIVHPSLPAKTLKQFIAFAKARPGELLYASAGYATNPHLAIELLSSMANIRMTHVAYQGGAPSITAILTGEVVLTASSSMSILIPHVEGGRLRALGVTSATRSPALPEVPTIAEAGLPGYEAIQWAGLLAPAKTPRPIVEKLHKEVVSILNMPEMRDRLFKLGNFVKTSATPEEFREFIKDETIKWSRVAKAAGIEPK